MKEGDRVRVYCPENVRLHGTTGTILSFHDWGATLALPAAGTGRYRAGWWELEPVGESSGWVVANRAGEVCDRCGSLEMIRSGTCLTCSNCGTTSGGCS